VVSARPELIMVYNADSGILSTLLDAVQKVVTPSSYDCPLCKVTHGAVTMRWEWRQFLGSLPLAKTTLHRDEFVRLYPGSSAQLPAIFVREEGRLPVVLVDRNQLKNIDEIEGLKTVVEGALIKHHWQTG